MILAGITDQRCTNASPPDNSSRNTSALTTMINTVMTGRCDGRRVMSRSGIPIAFSFGVGKYTARDAGLFKVGGRRDARVPCTRRMGYGTVPASHCISYGFAAGLGEFKTLRT